MFGNLDPKLGIGSFHVINFSAKRNAVYSTSAIVIGFGLIPFQAI